MNDDKIDKFLDEIYNSTGHLINVDKKKEEMYIKGVAYALINLINDARNKKMFLYIGMYNKTFSPDELMNTIKKGEYLLPLHKWNLIKPEEVI